MLTCGIPRVMSREDFERIASDTVAGWVHDVETLTRHRPMAVPSCEYLGKIDQRTGMILTSPAQSVPQRAKIVFLLKAKTFFLLVLEEDLLLVQEENRLVV